MARTRQEGSPVESNVFTDNKYMTASAVITATFQIPVGAPTVWIFSAAAPQIIKLPAILEGAHYVIGSLTGGSTLTFQDSAGAALTPATTILSGASIELWAVKNPSTGVLMWMAQRGTLVTS